MSAPKATGPKPEPFSTDPGNNRPRCTCGKTALPGKAICRPCENKNINDEQRDEWRFENGGINQ